MNRNWLVIILLVCCSTSLLAQRGFELGPRFYPHLSSIKNKQDKASWDRNIISTGFDYGIEFAYSTRLTQSVRSGFFISETGDAFVRNGSYYSRRIQYIEVPMLYKFITDPFYIYMFSFYIGPNFKIQNGASHELLHFSSNEQAVAYANQNRGLKEATLETKLNYLEEFNINFRNTENLYRNYSIDLTLGLGFDFPINSFILFNSYLRWDYSVFNIENKKYEIKFERFWNTHWTESDNRTKVRNYDIGIVFGLTLIMPKRW